jgi:hypothetical protein
LFAVCPDVAKLLVVVALEFIGLYHDGNVSEVGQFK